MSFFYNTSRQFAIFSVSFNLGYFGISQLPFFFAEGLRNWSEIMTYLNLSFRLLDCVADVVDLGAL